MMSVQHRDGGRMDERVVRGWDGLPRIGHKYGPIYLPEREREDSRDENLHDPGGYRDIDGCWHDG